MANFHLCFNVVIMPRLLSKSMLMWCLFTTPALMADPINGEKQLLIFSKKQQCQIVTAAPKKGDSVSRLETENLIAVWCSTSMQDRNPQYDILIAIKDTDHEWIDCPSLIPISATHTPPFIEVKKAKINGQIQQLDQYNYLSTDKTTAEVPGPESEIADGDGLYIGHWDAEQTLYCYDDKWLISEFH